MSGGWQARTRAYNVVLATFAVFLLPAAVLSGHHDDLHEHDHEHEHHHKHVSSGHGHSLFDLSTLGLLVLLKIKVILLLLAAGTLALFFKGYKGLCYGPYCRPYPYGYYPYIDYNYVGYEVPPGTYVGSASAPYRRRPAVPKGMDFGELTARLWNSVDIAELAFSAMDVHQEECRRRLVCQADAAASTNPLLRAALSWFSGSLARYRSDRPTRSDPPICAELYPACNHPPPPLLPPPLPLPPPPGSPGSLVPVSEPLPAPEYPYLRPDAPYFPQPPPPQDSFNGFNFSAQQEPINFSAQEPTQNVDTAGPRLDEWQSDKSPESQPNQ